MTSSSARIADRRDLVKFINSPSVWTGSGERSAKASCRVTDLRSQDDHVPPPPTQALRFGGRRRLLNLGGELGVTARNVTGLVDALQRDGPVERLPHPTDRRTTLARLTPPGDRVAGVLLAEQRAVLAELPEADQRHLVQALESLRAVLARHPDFQPAHPAVSRTTTRTAKDGQPLEPSSRRRSARPSA